MSKSILKKSKNDGRKKTLLWDEANLEETSKGRGTRQKIDEPDTPYHYPGDFSISESGEEESEDSLHSNAVWDQLHVKLEVEKQKQEQGIDLVSDQQKKEEKRKEFLQKRKSHYNEGKKWKEMGKETVNKTQEEPNQKETIQEPEKNLEPPSKKRKF